MQFHYAASEPGGKIIEGDLEAKDQPAVLEWIVSKGLRPVSIRRIGRGSKKFKLALGPAITLEDKVFITKYLSLMLKVGTDLFRAIDILVADFDKPAVKSLLIEVKDGLSRGQPFYTTFAKYPKYFSSVFVNLIKAGEASGNLDKVFADLSVGLEKEQILRSKIRGAMVYPIVLLSLASIILLLLVAFALPRLAEVFLAGGVEPPLFSRIVFSIGIFMGDNIWWILSILAVLGTGSAVFFGGTLLGRSVLQHIGMRVPVINKVAYTVGIQRFATTFSSLLRSGMPILEAIETTADASGNAELKLALMRVSREGIAKGLTIGEAFQREPYFSRVVVNLIAVSEKAGHIEEILDTLADFYEREIDASIKTLLALLEPALLFFIGILVATIALAIIIPIYQLVGGLG
ncbi:MAG: type II secretion system F family protein [Candidatus Colwellbacteria bacterium]|nr:type II secretion system F family protein [Candidatus Colwellbacteria bacterium]